MIENTQIEMDVLFIVIGWVVIVLGLMILFTLEKSPYKSRNQINLNEKDKSTIELKPVSHETK